MKQKIVLCLEDTPSRVRWLEAIAKEHGAVVHFTDNVKFFLELCRAHSAAELTIVLDHDLGGYAMPVSLQDADGLDGIDAVQQMPVLGAPVLIWSTTTPRHRRWKRPCASAATLRSRDFHGHQTGMRWQRSSTSGSHDHARPNPRRKQRPFDFFLRAREARTGVRRKPHRLCHVHRHRSPVRPAPDALRDMTDYTPRTVHPRRHPSEFHRATV
jgi:CheY-like chemotaxis protein